MEEATRLLTIDQYGHHDFKAHFGTSTAKSNAGRGGKDRSTGIASEARSARLMVWGLQSQLGVIIGSMHSTSNPCFILSASDRRCDL